MQMSGPSFRTATRADLEEIVALLADDTLGAARENPSLPLDQRYLDAFCALEADPNNEIVVAIRGGAVIGCLQITLIPGLSRLGMQRGQIEGVRVAASERGLGTGRAMLEWAIARCRQKGCALVQLTTDKSRAGAKRFYEGLGFTASHDGMKLMV